MTHATNSSLEEQLAAKFYALIHRSQRHDFRPFTSIGHGEKDPWLQMAREALRVAEYARKQHGARVSADEEDETLHWPDLTLPPADWTCGAVKPKP